MIYRSRTGLPAQVQRAMELASLEYDGPRDDRAISVTSLMGPPQMRRLSLLHGESVVVDVEDHARIFLGQAIHRMMEAAITPGVRAEWRLEADLDGVLVSGAVDHFDPSTGVLTDYKVTSAWSVVLGKKEWEQQLNVYAWLLRRHGQVVNKAQVLAFLTDRSTLVKQRERSRQNTEDWPKEDIVLVDIPLWDGDETVRYLRERLKAHADPDARCSPEELWVRNGKPQRCGYCTWSKVCQQRKEMGE